MIAVVLGVAVGFLGVRIVLPLLAPTLRSPMLARVNYRGRPLPTGAGILVAMVAVGVEGVRSAAGTFGLGDGPGLTTGRALVLMTVVGFCFLGFVDDVLGTDTDRGFRGHVRALGRGRLTTGMIKLVGGAALAVLVATPAVGRSPGRLAVDALLVALAANTGNLLDRAPGRTCKAGLAVFLVLVLGTRGATGLGAVAVAMGGALGLLGAELREQLMLGDAGANALGGVLGLGVVLTCGVGVRDVALVLVVVVNIVGELTSLGHMVESTPGLRAVDRAGRLR